MRRFIYLDTDTLNSYIAQIYDGLVQSEEKEKQTFHDEKNENAHQILGDAGADFKILGKGIEGKIGYAYSNLKDTSNMELIRDVQTKMLHDNAFDQLVEYLQDKKLLLGGEIGDFIEIYDSFYIMDLDYYNKIFGDKKILQIMKSGERGKIEAQLKVLQDAELQLPNANTNEINKKYKALSQAKIKESDASFDSIKEIIELLITLIPYRKTLCIGDNMVVLNDKYMRDEINMASFKYGGKIKVLGYITNQIGKTDKNNSNQPVFASIGNILNETMLSFFTGTQNLKIIHPIAVYYD